MDIPIRGVMVIEVPPTVEAKQAKEFVRELANGIERVIRPRVVLDCARVRRVDSTFLHLLLCSLEETMKRNGDVRLSGLPDAARPALESLGMQRLFRLYPTAAQATESFRRSGESETALTPSQSNTDQASTRAA